MQKIDIMAGMEGQHIATSVFLPDDLQNRSPILVFASPGGGYARGYFDIQIDVTYSQAEHHASRNIIFVAYDHLGVGDSDKQDIDRLSIEDIATANHNAVMDVTRRLREGTLIDGLPATNPRASIGIGQSMGGGVTMIMQAKHRSFDAYAGLGWSAIQSVLPQKAADVRDAIKQMSSSLGRNSDIDTLETARHIRQDFDYRYPFHWDDVPDEIIRADLGVGFPTRTTPVPWGSMSMPRCVAAMRGPGYVTQEAAMIDVPVLMAFGERDVSEYPWAEASAFPRCRDFTLFIAPAMAHMHNFASTRQLFWDRLVRWYHSVAP